MPCSTRFETSLMPQGFWGFVGSLGLHAGFERPSQTSDRPFSRVPSVDAVPIPPMLVQGCCRRLRLGLDASEVIRSEHPRIEAEPIDHVREQHADVVLCEARGDEVRGRHNGRYWDGGILGAGRAGRWWLDADSLLVGTDGCRDRAGPSPRLWLTQTQLVGNEAHDLLDIARVGGVGGLSGSQWG